MAWICSPSDANCIVKFYSIADDLQTLNAVVFDFLMSLAPGVWLTVILIFIVSFIVMIFLSIRHQIKMQALA